MQSSSTSGTMPSGFSEQGAGGLRELTSRGGEANVVGKAQVAQSANNCRTEHHI